MGISPPNWLPTSISLIAHLTFHHSFTVVSQRPWVSKSWVTDGRRAVAFSLCMCVSLWTCIFIFEALKASEKNRKLPCYFRNVPCKAFWPVKELEKFVKNSSCCSVVLTVSEALCLVLLLWGFSSPTPHPFPLRYYPRSQIVSWCHCRLLDANGMKYKCHKCHRYFHNSRKGLTQETI